MNRSLIKVYYVTALMLFTVSCSSKKEGKVGSPNFTKNEVVKKKEVVVKQSHSNITEVSMKMQKQKKLTEADYICICNFLLNNKDESQSEEIGYCLFEYLKGKELNNSAFISFLNKKDISFKEKVECALVQIMCIDIGEDNYSYNKFIEDFSMFKNSPFAMKVFNECMSNQ